MSFPHGHAWHSSAQAPDLNLSGVKPRLVSLVYWDTSPGADTFLYASHTLAQVSLFFSEFVLSELFLWYLSPRRHELVAKSVAPE